VNDFLEPRFLAVCLFLLFIAACLFMAMWVSPDLHIGDGFFRGGKQLGAVPTGLAFASDIMPTAAVLYLLGTVALGGLDGVIIFACAAASPVLMRLWLAGRLPAARGRTFGEMVTRHLPNGPAKRWVAIACLVVVVPLLIGQLQPLGHAAQLIGLSDPFARRLVVILAGGLILACSAIGAARGATMHQIGTAASFLLIAPVMAAMVLLRFDGDIGTLLETAERQQGGTGAYFGTGGIFGEGIAGHLDLLSYGACVLVGAAFLPHIAVRLSGLPDARSARRAASVGAAALCFLISTAMFIGFGIGALVGREELAQEGPFGGVNMALLAMALDGSEAGDVGKLLFFIMCAVFLTILASASVLLLSGSAAIVHDLGLGGSADSEPDNHRDREAVQARLAMVGLGCFSILVAALTIDVSPQFWLVLTYTETVSTLLPLLVFSLGKRPISAAAIRYCVLVTTVINLVLISCSPLVSSTTHALFPAADWSVWPLTSPSLLSVPTGFLICWASSRRAHAAQSDKDAADGDESDEPVTAPLRR
jgi:cation/acetate symporter